MRYIKGLDGLRAIAVALVIVQHYYYDYLINQSNSIGSLGVSVFFVLSGFLITGILIREKDKPEQGSFKKYLQFTIRRSIRIFPLYYLVLLIGSFSGIYWFSEISQWWHVLYATNIYMFIHGDWTGYTVHFWSLDVEEQFYLLWPIAIFITPKKHLLTVIVGTVLMGPLSLLLRPFLGINGISAYVLPFTHMDALGMGALLAWFVSRHGIKSMLPSGMIALNLFFSLITYFAYEFYKTHNNVEAIHYLNRVSVITLTCLTIYYIMCNQEGMLSRALELKPLKYIGTISYGIYLIHKLTPEIFVGTEFTPVATHSNLNMFVWVLVTIILSAISWHLLERPILAKKDSIEKILIKPEKLKASITNSRH